MRINSVAVIGAGAIGAYFIWGFSRCEDLDFCLIAKGERKERLEKQGIEINGKTYFPPVRLPKEARGADLLMVCTKYSGLFDVLEDIRTAADPHTTVISTLNGVDSEEIIGEVIDPAQIVNSLMRIDSARAGGSVRFDPDLTMGIYFGERDTSEETERIRALEELFERAGLKYVFEGDILRDQWQKFSLNIAYNLPQAVLGVGIGAYFNSSHVAYLRDRLEQEVQMVAAAEGYRVDPLSDFLSSHPKNTRFSTLQDLDAGRHTEIDMFLGTLIKKAEKHGLKVPFSEYTFHAIHALEEKNDGLFDFG